MDFFKDKKYEFERGFKKMKSLCMWLLTGLLDLKNTEQLKFSLMVYFYAFLKVLHFSKNSRFSKFINSSF